MDKGVVSRIELCRSFFSEKEKVLVRHGEMYASVFLYDTGVHGLRVKNSRGGIVVLPYQGQQVWDCTFDGRELTMKSMFDKPVQTMDYLGTYGGFLLHCGATAMGVPSEKDTHPLHGELPNAPYQKAYIDAGWDENGRFIGVGGEYEHIVAFNHHYAASPYIKLYENAAVMSASISITNLKQKDMELMYMMHINFRPIDYSTLIYSAKCDPENVKAHVSIPSHMQMSGESAKFAEFLKKMAENPCMHNTLTPDLMFDPEIVFTVKYLADENGYAYSMQRHPDGYASYVRHKPGELPFGIRWISRSLDQDAMGLVLPSTAEHKGYTEEKRKGNIMTLGPKGKIEFHVDAGLLKPEESKEVEKRIESITARS